MLDMQITLQQQRNTLAANLNYLLYRPAGTPVGAVPDFTLPKINSSAEQLNRLAAEHRPQVKSLTLLADKGRAAHRLAEKEYYPDFNLSFEYMFREASMNDPGYNMFTLGLTFNLPFQLARRKAMVAESAAETSMSAEELNALKNNIGFQVNDLLGQLERRQKLTELYKGGIIPQAEQSLESAVIAYRVGKVDFMTLLDGRINLFNYEREYHESMAEYMMKLAQLEALVGSSLTTAMTTPAAGNTGSQGN
jgi:outer membrane protein TolC